jgi:hypothetical protein
MTPANPDVKTAMERADLAPVSGGAVARAGTFGNVARWIEEALDG